MDTVSRRCLTFAKWPGQALEPEHRSRHPGRASRARAWCSAVTCRRRCWPVGGKLMNLTSFVSHRQPACLAPQQAGAWPRRLHGYLDHHQHPPSSCGVLARLHARL